MVYHRFSTFWMCLLVWVLVSILGGRRWGFWPSCVCRTTVITCLLPLTGLVFVTCLLDPFSVFVTNDNHVLCWPFCLGSTLVQLIKWSIFVEQKASVTALLWRETGNQSKSFVPACLCTWAHCAQIFSGIFFAGLAGWLSMANGTKLSFIQQAVVLLYGQDTLHREGKLD